MDSNLLVFGETSAITEDWREIDWDKVQSLEDIKTILYGMDLKVERNSESGKYLKDYLKEK